MHRILSTIVALGVFILIPVVAAAKPPAGDHGKEHGGSGSPAPNPAAYEHADENARFQRDTHDMGKLKETTTEKMKEEEKEKVKEKEKEKTKEKVKSDGVDQGKEKAGTKERSKGSTGKNEKTGDGENVKKDKSDADALLEKVRKPKDEKAR